MDSPVRKGSSVTPEIITIAGVAHDCMLAFHHALELTASLSPREHSMIEDQLARLSLWCVNIGVFAPNKMSMDYRMREVPDIQAVVTGLLEAVQYQIEKCPDFATPNSPRKEATKEEAEASRKAKLDELNHIVRSVADGIGLLYKLSNTIRRASRDSQNEKAATSFKMTDQDENDLEIVFRERFASNISDLFPSISPALKDRLAATMIVRRKRVLYRRHRLDRNQALAQAPIVPKRPITQPVTQRSPAQPQIGPAKRPESRLNAEPKSIAESQAQSATTLAAIKFHQSSPSVVSATETIAIDSHDDLIFPPPPLGYIKRNFHKRKAERKAKRSTRFDVIRQDIISQDDDAGILLGRHLEDLVQEQEEADFKASLRRDWKTCNEQVVEVVCPFCSCSLSSTEMKDHKKWSHHVKNDLDEYVCLFETCDSADEIYRHSTEWLKHMRQHSLRWRCNAKIHSQEIFSKREDYEKHLRVQHKSNYTDPQLRTLADRNARPLEKLFESCPLCGGQPEGGRMEDHIAGHLRFLALKSLPRVEDDMSDTSGGSKTDGGTLKKPASRSTVNEDPEYDQRPDFIDPYARIAPENINVHDRVGNPYSQWGGFASYITMHPEGVREKWPSSEPPYSQLFGKPPSLNIVPKVMHETELIVEDDSRWFVDSSVISAIPPNELRQFEWGFMPANKSATVEPAADPILQAIEKSIRQKQALQPTEPNYKRESDMFRANLHVPMDITSSLEGYSGSVTSVTFSPDDKQVISGSDDQTTRIWHRAPSRPPPNLRALLREVREVCSTQLGRCFVPRSRQDSILTVEAIEDDIRRCGSAISIDRARVYAQWARDNGRKLYATLAYIERGADVRHLVRQDISDKDLPLNYIRGALSTETETRGKGGLFLKTGVRVKDIDHWKEKELEEFFNIQWWMIAPVFKDKAELELAAREVLPFLPFDGEDTDKLKAKQGAFSEVFPVNIHYSHHEFWNSDDVETKETLVAVKRLFSTDETDFKKERDVLKILGSKSPPHPHLIRLLATYRQKWKYHLIFPYADSNLRSYWEQRPLPEFDHGTVMWTLSQMSGIADALFRLHEFKVTIPMNVGDAGNIRVQSKDDGQISVRAGENIFGRHGDIKPENILYFSEGPEAKDPQGVLKLAGFGLAEFHGRDSKSGISSSEIVSAPTYEPPECKLRRPVSQAYDLWSCGCMWLEFITWLLKGSAAIDEFADWRGGIAGPDEIDDDNFFTIPRESNSFSEATIRDGVIRWVERLHQHDRCSQLIHDLLNLTMDHLLLIDSNDRIEAGQFNRQMADFYQRAKENPDYMLKPAPLSPEDSKAIFLGIPRYEGSGSQMSFSDPMKVSVSRNSSASRKSGDLSPNSGKTVTWPSDLAKG